MIDKLTLTNRFKFFAPYFRLFLCFYLLKDIIIMWDFNDIIYKGNSFVSPEISTFLEFFNINSSLVREHFYVFYFCYFVLIMLFLFGIGKRITALLLFLSVEVIQSFAWLTLNGGDNILKFALLYMIFINSYERFSLKKLHNKSTFSTQLSNFLSNLGGYSLCIHFCLVYFISAMHKIHADVWFNGIATYYVLGSERYGGTPWNTMLIKNGIFVTLTTYGTIFIELLFPFFVWNKHFKYYMIALAISLHTGIGVFMMLYDFQMLFIVILGFFISNNEWENIIQKIKSYFIKYKIKYSN